MASITQSPISCPACESGDIEHNKHGFDGICRTCGFVIPDRMNLAAPDWKTATQLGDETETLDWWSFCRVQDSTEEQLALAFDSVENLSSDFTVSRALRQEAAEVYSAAFCAGATDGRETNCFVAVCLSLAAQKMHEPIPTSRLIETVSVSKTAFYSSLRALRETIDTEVPSPTPVEYISFLSSELGLSEDEHNSAVDLLERMSGATTLIGKSPVGIASAAVYITCDRTQKQIAAAGGISSETVRQRVRDIRELEQP